MPLSSALKRANLTARGDRSIMVSAVSPTPRTCLHMAMASDCTPHPQHRSSTSTAVQDSVPSGEADDAAHDVSGPSVATIAATKPKVSGPTSIGNTHRLSVANEQVGCVCCKTGPSRLLAHGVTQEKVALSTMSLKTMGGRTHHGLLLLAAKPKCS